MIDILTAQPGDLVVYGPYLCSEGLENNRYMGIYQGFMYWSPDERPIELWVNLKSQEGLNKFVRASQVTNVYRSKQKTG